jgi:hypothetical protein
MAKPKKQASATPKKRSTKYSKLAAVCSKELAAKKKALVLAEKRLAKAQKTHQELLAEVARLDMLERSLKAVNEGLEPPQNVRYVYSYPQWVWYGNPNGWYWNGNSYTYTIGNYQGGSSLCNYNNSVNTITTPSVQTFTTAGNVQTSGALGTIGSNSINLCSTIGSGTITCDSGITNSGSVLTSTSNGGTSWVTPTYDTFQNNDAGVLTIDLSTGATEDEPKVEEAEEEAVEVGNGG